MSFTAADVMRRASTILQDADAVHWTAVELCDWLNEGMRAIVTIKPNAKTESMVLSLVSGTKQSLPENVMILSKIVRNVGGAPGNLPGKAIRTLARREIIDAQIPEWHSTSGLAYSAVVDMAFQDPMSPREFYVVPGNTGTGRIEAIVGILPTPVPRPSSGVLDVSSYGATVPLADEYQGILLDFVLFRAFSKDSAAPDAANRAQAHLVLANQSLQALGVAQATMSLANAYGPVGVSQQ